MEHALGVFEALWETSACCTEAILKFLHNQDFDSIEKTALYICSKGSQISLGHVLAV